jgi:protein TonB
MKNENDVQSLDELVFEHRNKLYGAYVIRKSYADRLNRAVLLVFGSVLAVFLLTMILPSKAPNLIPKIPDGKIIGLVDQPSIDVEVQKPVKPTTVRKAPVNLAPVATKEPDPPVETPQAEAGSGAADGVEGGDAPEVGFEGTGTEVAATPAVPEVPTIRDFAEVMPQYNGGQSAMVKFLSTKMRYPAIARRTEVEGIVFVSFVINTDGTVIDAKVVKGISKECDAEALRVVSSMPRWLAGRQGNVPVMVRMVLPIKFQLAR